MNRATPTGNVQGLAAKQQHLASSTAACTSRGANPGDISEVLWWTGTKRYKHPYLKGGNVDNKWKNKHDPYQQLSAMFGNSWNLSIPSCSRLARASIAHGMVEGLQGRQQCCHKVSNEWSPSTSKNKKTMLGKSGQATVVDRTFYTLKWKIGRIHKV